MVRVERGFTLIEVIVSMLLVGIAVVALASALSVAFSHSADTLVHTKTAQLARSYSEEISARKYSETTPNGGVPPCSSATVACGVLGPDGESRGEFNDVDDYHNLVDAPPRDARGIVLDGFQGYQVDIEVAYANIAQVAAWGLDDSSDAKVVTVSVTPPASRPRVFTFVRGNF